MQGTKEPKTLEEFRRYLDDCDQRTRSEPHLSVDWARRAFSYLERLPVSPYVRRNLHMRTVGVLGSALVATGELDDAEALIDVERNKSPSRAERASLAIRLTRLYSEKLNWDRALSEGDMAVSYYRNHRPRYESDLRSLSGALVARGNVACLAFFIGAPLQWDACPAMRAEIDYRAALESASGNTEYSALVAGANLCKLALKLWWEEGEFKIRPATVAKEMEKICRTLSKRGIKFRSRPHANARWTYALAAVEAFGGLNRAAESKLERAFQDLLDLGAMTDAAGLALDFCYCLLRELRWEDAITVTSTLLQHPSADQLPRSWLLALRQWESALVKREVQHVISVISPTFGLIRGVSLTWRESCEGSRTPKSRYGDREDTLGL